MLDKEADHRQFFPISVDEAIAHLNGIIAENEKEARAYLKRFNAPFRDFPIRLLNEHTHDIEELLIPMKSGETWGLISDAGLPVLADPGYQLKERAFLCLSERLNYP